MQFTVLIEFLIPGLVTVLIGFAALYGGSWPTFPGGSATNEAVNALFLIAIAYPVGILTNFFLFQPQRHFITPVVRRQVITRHLGRGIFEERMQGVKSPSDMSRQKLEDIFGTMAASVFSKNIPRFDSQHQLYESLQRLARGMVLPAVLLGVWLGSLSSECLLLPVFVPALLAGLSIWLLCHTVRAEAELMVRFFSVTARDAGGSRSEA